MFLLDTNVVSELRKAASGRADRSVVLWAQALQATELSISVVTLMELETGILLIERQDRRQGQHLRQWLETQVIPAFVGRVIPIDTAIARRCAALHVPDLRSDRDSLIAATALVHRLTVVTRNVADFKGTKVRLLNPWEQATA